MVGMESEGEFLLGYTPCGMFEIVLRPVRGDRRPPRPVPCPELPRPPFFVPPPRTPSPQEQRDTPGGAEGIFFTPRMKQEETSPLLPFTTVIKREPVTPTPRPPPPRVAAAEGSIPPFRPPPPRWANSPQDPAPYQGIIVTEALPRQSSPCAEVRVEQLPIGVRVTTRTTTLDEHIEPVAEDLSLPRGVIRPHSVSPFTRNVKTKKEVDEAGDMEEALSCLLDFSKRTGLTTPPPPPPPMVRNFSTSTPRRPSSGPVTPFVLTPSTTPRPPSPPTILSRRPNLPLNIARPRPILRPSALGAPSSPVEEEELPDIPESPASPTVNDLTMISTLSTYYSSEEDEDENEDEEYSEHEYADPYEEEGPYSSTPPPDCDPAHPHNVCVPPAWGELITGPAVICRCILCHEDGRHHAIRCRQCRNAPGCCACIWGYMRSRYNSGCPLCRSGDPEGENPLRSEIHRRLPPRRRGGTLVGVGLVRGRGRRSRSYPPDYEQQQEQEEQAQRPPQRARRGRRGRGRGRAVTIEEDQPMN